MTHNELIKIFNDIADAHQQIQSFGTGDPWDRGASTDIAYPNMFVVPNPANISIEQRSDKSAFQVIFSDLVSLDKSNEQEVLSDQKQVALDVIAQLRLLDYDIQVDGDVRLEPFTDKDQDQVAGWVATITILTDIALNRCAVPSTLDPSSVGTCADARVLTSDGITVIITIPSGQYKTLTQVLSAASVSEINSDLSSAGKLTVILALHPATVKNSDLSYSASVVGDGTLITPDITVTNYDGTTSSSPSVKNITSTQLARGYNYPQPSGITASAITGDDYWVQQQYFSSLPTRIWRPSLNGFFKLAENNAFGNIWRFTGTAGGYYDRDTFQYKLPNGTVSDRATTYPGELMIDHYTGMMIYMTFFGPAASWSAAIAAAIASTQGGYSGWFIPNFPQTALLMSQSANYGLNWLPFNLSSIDTVAYWTSTPHIPSNTNAFYVFNDQLSFTAVTDNTRRYFIMRKHY